MAAQPIPINFGSRVGRSYPRAQAMDAQAAKMGVMSEDKARAFDFFTNPYWWFVKTTCKGMRHYNRIPYEMDLQVDPITGNLMVVGYERQGFGPTNPRSYWGSAPSN